MFLINLGNNLLNDKSGEVDEKAVLMVVLVLGTLGGVGLVAARVTGLLDSAAAGL
ncbi:MAG: hypothetical protein HN916_01020 [Anaerolineae bacterium]|jgi:hypothetical protein|nr:hypothetical protein [Anaerolineae bacterium]